MSVKVFASTLNKLAQIDMFSSLKNRNKKEKHIVIAPDRCSFIVEKKLFDVLDEKCFFDINVTTFSRLSRELITECGTNKKVLSKHSGVVIIKKILLENSEKIRNFGKAINFNGFCNNLYHTICLFKSCRVLPENIILNTSSQSLNEKLNDIKFVYEKYEEFLQNEYTDSFNQLGLFGDLIQKDTYKDVNFYLVAFEDFTPQMYTVLSKLFKYAKSVNIATTYGKTGVSSNSNIYLNSIYYNTIDICKQEGIEYECIFGDAKLPRPYDVLSKNIYGTKVVPQNLEVEPSSTLKLYKYTNAYQEISNTLLEIKNDIINNGKRYRNFAIILPNFADYEGLLKNELDKLDIPYFFDKNEQMSSHIISRVLFSFFDLITGKWEKNTVLEILKNKVLDVEETDVFNYEKLVNKYSLIGKSLFSPNASIIQGKEDLKELFSKLTLFEKFFIKSKENKNINDHIQLFSEFLEEIKFSEFLEKLKKSYLEKSAIQEFRQVEQVENKLQTVSQELTTVFGQINCSFEYFTELYKAYVEDISIALPPLSLDSVFIGDIENSYIGKYDHIYILGSNEGRMPSFSIDAGILSDKDIGRLGEKNKLSPTISLINKRKKFKVFEELFSSQNKTTISYTMVSLGGEEMYPSIFIQNITTLLGINIEDGGAKLDFVSGGYEKNNAENFIFNNVSKEKAKENFVHYLKQWNIFSKNKNYRNNMANLKEVLKEDGFVDKILKNKDYKNNIQTLSCSSQLFFQKPHTSVSHIEEFYTCPYKHFIKYGLRLKEEETSNISTRENGNILHDFLQVIMKELCLNYNNEEWVDGIKEFSYKSMEKVLEGEDYKHLKQNPLNKFFIDSLYKEGERICKAMIYQQKNSNYIPMLFEYSFGYGDTNSVKIMLPSGKNLSVTGKIDRVDFSNNGFRIIDYKTGSNSIFKNFSELYAGKKLQLFVYTYAFQKEQNKESLGAFYLPIRNSFSKNDNLKNYKLSGVFENSLENIFDLDIGLSTSGYTSNIVDLQTKTEGGFKNYKGFANMAISKEEMNFLMNFALQKMREGGAQIEGGEITPQPLEIEASSCRFCSYRGICNFNKNYGDIEKKIPTIQSVEQLKEKIQEDNELA